MRRRLLKNLIARPVTEPRPDRDDTSLEVLGEPFEDTARDIFVIQNRISTRIAEILQVKLSPSGARQAVRRPTTNEQAYEAYLQGMFYVRQSRPGSPDRPPMPRLPGSIPADDEEEPKER